MLVVGVVALLAGGGVAVGSPIERFVRYDVTAAVTVQALGIDADAPVVGQLVTAGAKVVAERRQTFDQVVIAARDQAGRNYDFPAVPHWSVGTRQKELTAGRTFDTAGSYTYWLRVSKAGQWTDLAPKQTFTVTAQDAPGGPDTDPSPTVSPSASPTPTLSPSPSPTTPSSSPSSSATAPAPPSGDFPNAGNTGVPAGTQLTVVDGDLNATTPGQVIDRKHIRGNLIIRADNVKVTNTQVDDSVVNMSGNPFTITDSTVGPASCGTATWQPMSVGFSNYTALRVKARGHEDGFRASGPGVVIRDSYYRACAPSPTNHADGVQDYPAAPGIVVDHNTFDQTGAVGYTAPIFVHSQGTIGATITDNLAKGGVYSLFLGPSSGTWIVTGNRVVNGSWAYGAYETEGMCAKITTWADNDVVTIDSQYAVTGTVKENVPCGA